MKYIGFTIFTLIWSLCIYDAIKHNDLTGVVVMSVLTAIISAVIYLNRNTK